MEWAIVGVIFGCACALASVVGVAAITSDPGSREPWVQALVRMWEATTRVVVGAWDKARGLVIGLGLSGLVVFAWAITVPLANEPVRSAPEPPSSPMSGSNGHIGPPGPKGELGEPGPMGDPGPVRTMSDAERLEQDIARLEALNKALGNYGEPRPRLHEEGGR